MPDEVAKQADPYCARTLNAVIQILEGYEVSVGNSAAGEIAAEMTMAALREIRDQVCALARPTFAVQPALTESAPPAKAVDDGSRPGTIADLAMARCEEEAFRKFVKKQMGWACYNAHDAAHFIITECCVNRLADLDRDSAARARFERNIDGPYLQSLAPTFVVRTVAVQGISAAVFSTGARSPMDTLDALARELQSKNVRGPVLVDLLLVNGTKDRYYLANFDGERFSPVRMQNVDSLKSEFREMSAAAYKEIATLVDASLLAPDVQLALTNGVPL